jgi:hypothetical protein
MPQSPDEYVPPVRYLVVRHRDEWMIKFEGEEFGPYNSKREAMLFAIDAAQKLGLQDEPTEVLVMGEAGEANPAWSFGQPPYPPAL